MNHRSFSSSGSGTALSPEATRFGQTPATISFAIREPGSALTHFAGLLLTLIGAGPLVMRASMHGSAFTVASLWVFLICTCLMYGASTTYHTVVLGEASTKRFRKLDHSMISVMIAGTYTPICLTVLRDSIGVPMLLGIWCIAIGGILVKVAWITCPKWFSSVLYVAMGWLSILAVRPLLEKLPLAAFLWLLSGGILYTIGAVIYALKLKCFNARHKYFGSHEVFHLFIMAGTLCHYVMMYAYIAYQR